MLLHHYLCVALLGLSYMFNCDIIAFMVLVVHDFSDMVLTTSRVYDGLKIKIKSVWYAVVGATIVVWAYTRLYVFPTCLISSAYKLAGT